MRLLRWLLEQMFKPPTIPPCPANLGRGEGGDAPGPYDDEERPVLEWRFP